jgi:hypothetical protein
MKFKVCLLIFCVLLLSGCGAEKYKKECLEKAKDMYAKINDEKITSCVIEYAEEQSSTLYTFCVTDEKVVYASEHMVFKPGDTYYDQYWHSYEQIKDEVTTHVDGYYTYEFKADELK